MLRRVSQQRKRECAARAGWQCFRCGELVDSFYEIDHHVPLHLGGSNEPENLVLLCLGCHRDKTQEEMLAFSRGGAIARRRAGAAYGWCCVLCEERLDASFRLIGEEPVCSGCAGVVLAGPRTKSVRRCKGCGAIYSAWFVHHCD